MKVNVRELKSQFLKIVDEFVRDNKNYGLITQISWRGKGIWQG